MIMKRIHILGASGSGTTTLGSALAHVLPHTHLDSDNYFWETKFTNKRLVHGRRELLEKDFSLHENWILSGSVCNWENDLKNYFDLVIFLWIPQDIRIERLKRRETQRYGKEILTGGSMYEESQAFLQWASLYDSAGMEVRSKVLQEQWMSDLSCPVLRIEGDYSIGERVDIVLNFLALH